MANFGRKTVRACVSAVGEVLELLKKIVILLVGESMCVRQSRAQAEAIAWPHLELGNLFKRAHALLRSRNDSIASKRAVGYSA